MSLDFTHPLALLLLGLLPAFWLIDRASRTHLPRRRRRLVLWVRLAVVLLVVLALAGPRVIGQADQQAVAFLVDVSDSVTPSMRERELAWLREAINGMGERDRAAIIAFGDQAVVERPLSSARQVAPIASIVGGGQTDISAAIRLALATLPSTVARKIVLISDGNENVGRAIDQARVARATKVPILAVPLSQQLGPEVLVRQLETPAFVRDGETFSAVLTIEASQDTVAQVHLLADGKLLSSQSVELSQGINSIVLPQDPLGQGFHLFRAQIESATDSFVQNNEGGSYTVVTGRPRVLVVESDAGEARYLADALRSAGLEVDIKEVNEAILDLPTLRGYESLVLANVPAAQLSVTQMRAINSYVQNLGGGLVVIGGEKSYGVGRYNRTPLEEALPVRMDLRGRTLTASVALILVIDASGSMAGGPGSSKMDLAKEAAIRATELLSEQDQVGVLSFDDTSRWVVETQFLTDPGNVQTQIGSISPGGGTAIYPAVETAFNDIVARDAKVKHILLLTDAQMVIKDTQEVARAAIVEEPFRPTQVGASPILEGIDVSLMPPLLGYVSTTPKPTSQILLVSKQVDPILSEWQYGLGHVVAWTSDAKNRWAQDWLTWPDFSRFWAQVVKRTIPNPIDRNLQVQITPEGSTARVTVDAISDDKTYQNFLSTSATVVDPSNTQSQIPLPQVAPGRYEGRLPITTEGAYFLNIVQTSPDGTLQAGRPAGFVIPYSAEYRDLRANPELLGQIARETGGKILAEPRDIFIREQTVSGQPRELWPPLLVLAALLFLFDVAARRLRLGWMDAERAWAHVLDNWLGRARRAAAPAAAKLLAAKSRISIEAAGFADGRRGEAARASPSAAGSAQAVGEAQPRSSSVLGARLLDAKKRAAPRSR